MLHRLVVRKANLSEKIKTQKGKYHNPYCKVNLPVEYAPVVGLVRNAQEFQTKCDFDEAEYNLHRIEPAASALFELLQKGREESENGERKCKCKREGKHGDHRSPELALS